MRGRRRVLSLFAGIGGFDLAAEQAGMVVVGQAELEVDETTGRPRRRQPNQQVLRRHWPTVPQFGDVREVHGDECGPVDVVCAGWPCQDLSVAGRRFGLAGARSGLFFQLARILADVRPPWAVLENVPGLLSSHGGGDFAAVLTALSGADVAVPDGGWRTGGYCAGPRAAVAWRVLDAQHFGVAQRRRRVWLVVHSRDRFAPVEVLHEPESGPRDPAPSTAARADVAGPLGGGADGSGWPDDLDRMTFVPTVTTPTRNGDPRDAEDAPDIVPAGGARAAQPVAAALTGRYGKGPDSDATDPLLLDTVAHPLTAGGADASEDGTGRGTPLVVTPLRAAGAGSADSAGIGRAGDPALSLDTDGSAALVAYRKAQRAHHADDGETWLADELANTVDAGGHGPRTAQLILRADAVVALPAAPEQLPPMSPGGGVAVDVGGRWWWVGRDVQVRRLTPIECLRLQGFPDDWLDGLGLPDSVKYHQVGNAIPVPVAAWIARRIMAWETGTLHAVGARP